MSISLYKVKDKKIIKTNETDFADDGIYIIIDKHMKRARIWVWSGQKADNTDRYFAGVSATSIKSKEKLYGATIEVVEAGNEPESFPKMENLQLEEVPIEEQNVSIVPAPEIPDSTISDDEIEIVDESKSKPVSSQIEETKETEIEPKKESKEPTATSIVGKKKPKAAAPLKRTGKVSYSDKLFLNRVKAVLKDLSRSLEEAQKKIDSFLMDL